MTEGTVAIAGYVAGDTTKDVLKEIPLLGSLMGTISKSALAGANVYVVGYIISRRLLGNTKRLSIKERIAQLGVGLSHCHDMAKNAFK